MLNDKEIIRDLIDKDLLNRDLVAKILKLKSIKITDNEIICTETNEVVITAHRLMLLIDSTANWLREQGYKPYYGVCGMFHKPYCHHLDLGRTGEDYEGTSIEEVLLKAAHWVYTNRASRKDRWVRYNGDDGVFTKGEILFNKVEHKYGDYYLSEKHLNFIKWFPRNKEWCFFWNEEINLEIGETVYLGLFRSIKDGKYITNKGLKFDRCEPYLHKVPKILLVKS